MSHNHITKTYNFGISNLKNQLLERKKELEEALALIERSSSGFPQGNLRICRKKGKPQYYQIIQTGDTNGQYLRKSEIGIAEALAQKNYCKELSKSLENEIAAIHSLLTAMENCPETVYDRLIKERKEIVDPMFLSDDAFTEMWLMEDYESDPYYPEEKNKETERGEFVRSKSEQFIANIYYDLGIPYRYEARLDLENGRYKYPDFTLLDVKKRKIIYHEHLGLMDKYDYRNNSIRKLNLYADHGILQGKNLIITYETDEIPFNAKGFKKMIKEMIL